MLHVQIAGMGKYLPEHVVSSAALEEQLRLPAGWIERVAGVRERRYALTETSSGMAAVACAAGAGCRRSRTGRHRPDRRRVFGAAAVDPVHSGAGAARARRTRRRQRLLRCQRHLPEFPLCAAPGGAFHRRGRLSPRADLQQRGESPLAQPGGAGERRPLWRLRRGRRRDRGAGQAAPARSTMPASSPTPPART
jgi:hypothetical protein